MIKKFNEIKTDEIKTISQLIDYLNDVKNEHGDIGVCVSEPHEYWSSVETWLIKGYTIYISDNAQPDGPKSGKSVKSIIFGK